MKFDTSLHDQCPNGFQPFDGDSNETELLKKNTYSFDGIHKIYGMECAASCEIQTIFAAGWLGKKINDQTATARIFLQPYFDGIERTAEDEFHTQNEKLDQEKIEAAKIIAPQLLDRIKSQLGYKGTLRFTMGVPAINITIPDNSSNPLEYFERIQKEIAAISIEWENGTKPFGEVNDHFQFRMNPYNRQSSFEWQNLVAKSENEKGQEAIPGDAITDLVKKYFPVGKTVVQQQQGLFMDALIDLLGKGQSPT